MDSTHIVDDVGGDPNTGICRGLDDCAQLSFGNKVSHGFLDRLGCSVRLSCSLSVDVGLRPGLSSSESLLQRLGVIDDLGRNPDASSWHHLDRGNDLGNLLDVGHGLGNGFVHGDRGWDGLGINL